MAATSALIYAVLFTYNNIYIYKKRYADMYIYINMIFDTKRYKPTYMK